MQKSVKSKKVERGEGGEAGVAGDAQGWRCSAVQQSTQNALSTCKKMALSQESKRERSWSKMQIVKKAAAAEVQGRQCLQDRWNSPLLLCSPSSPLLVCSFCFSNSCLLQSAHCHRFRYVWVVTLCTNIIINWYVGCKLSNTFNIWIARLVAVEKQPQLIDVHNASRISIGNCQPVTADYKRGVTLRLKDLFLEPFSSGGRN